MISGFNYRSVRSWARVFSIGGSISSEFEHEFENVFTLDEGELYENIQPVRLQVEIIEENQGKQHVPQGYASYTKIELLDSSNIVIWTMRTNNSSIYMPFTQRDFGDADKIVSDVKSIRCAGYFWRVDSQEINEYVNLLMRYKILFKPYDN